MSETLGGDARYLTSYRNSKIVSAESKTKYPLIKPVEKPGVSMLPPVRVIPYPKSQSTK